MRRKLSDTELHTLLSFLDYPGDRINWAIEILQGRIDLQSLHCEHHPVDRTAYQLSDGRCLPEPTPEQHQHVLDRSKDALTRADAELRRQALAWEAAIMAEKRLDEAAQHAAWDQLRHEMRMEGA